MSSSHALEPAHGEEAPVGELNANGLSPALRRRIVRERFDRLAIGDSLVIRYDRHPLPILYSLSEDRFGKFTGTFLER